MHQSFAKSRHAPKLLKETVTTRIMWWLDIRQQLECELWMKGGTMTRAKHVMSAQWLEDPSWGRKISVNLNETMDDHYHDRSFSSPPFLWCTSRFSSLSAGLELSFLGQFSNWSFNFLCFGFCKWAFWLGQLLFLVRKWHGCLGWCCVNGMWLWSRGSSCRWAWGLHLGLTSHNWTWLQNWGSCCRWAWGLHLASHRLMQLWSQGRRWRGM